MRATPGQRQRRYFAIPQSIRRRVPSALSPAAHRDAKPYTAPMHKGTVGDYDVGKASTAKEFLQQETPSQLDLVTLGQGRCRAAAQNNRQLRKRGELRGARARVPFSPSGEDKTLQLARARQCAREATESASVTESESASVTESVAESASVTESESASVTESVAESASVTESESASLTESGSDSESATAPTIPSSQSPA